MNEASEQSGHEPLYPDRLTWAVLLGRWVEFARSAVGLPDTAEGTRMRESVPDIIMLQAVWFALDHLEDLDTPERSLGLDRAQVLIEKHTTALQERWQNTPMPALLKELINDARDQLAKAADVSQKRQNAK